MPSTPAYRCSEPAIVLSRDPEEEERTSGHRSALHQDRSETMQLGMLLEPEYPAVQYSPGHTMCEGREAWLRFHMQPQSSVGMVRRRVIGLIEEQWRKSA